MVNIQHIAHEMQNTSDLLNLINAIKKDELGDKYHAYTMKQMVWFANPDHVFHRYYQFEIPKKSGGTRQINAPWSRSYMHLLRYVAMILQSVYEPSAHTMGFVPGRSIVSNAQAHVGMHYVFNIDLKDFFPSIERQRIAARLQVKPFCFPWKVAQSIAGLCTMRVDQRYVLPQGSPASPVLTNLMCDKLDFLLSGVAKRFGLRYTRYADDITFSSMHNVYQEDSAFRKELERIITEQGFTINPKKTRLNIVGARQEVTGLTVNNKVNVSRRFIKDLRGLLYIWEKYGYAASRPRVVEGKIAFLKMVKGASDPTYLKLQERYNKLMHRCHKNQPLHTDVLYRETMTVAAFEQKFHTTLSLVGDPTRLARFEVDDKDTWVLIKHTADMTLPKEQLCISYCELKDRSDHFWLIHEPYISHLFKKPD